MQPALIGPPVIAGMVALLGVYPVLFRGFESHALGIMFPRAQVGPGDVGLVILASFVLFRLLAIFARSASSDRGRPVVKHLGPPSWSAVCQTHGTFGFNIWGAAAGVATRKSNLTTLPTTTFAPIMSAVVICAAYHVLVLVFSFVVCALFAAPLMHLMANIGTLNCLKASFACDGGAGSWSAFFVSIAWMTTSAVFWLWISDLWLGVRRISEVHRTIQRIEFGAVDYRKASAGTSSAVEILHLSDLHFVGSDLVGRAESFGREPIGNRLLESRLVELEEELQRCDVVVLSGDLTDTGSSAEWQALQNIIGDWPECVKQKIFLVPGNHDVNIVTHANNILRVHDTDTLHGRHLRQALFARFALQFTQPGDEHATLTASSQLELCPANLWFDALRNGMDAFVQAMGAGEMPPTTGNAFSWRVPILVRKFSTAAGKFVLVGVDTSNWGLTGFSNALGSSHALTHRCVIECVRALAKENFIPIVVGHHAMIPIYERGMAPSSGSKTRDAKAALFAAGAAQLYGDAWFESLVDSSSAHGFIYLHGHRHVTRHIATELAPGRRAYLLGAPSLLFGDELDELPTNVALRHRIWMQRDEPGSPIISTVSQLWVETTALHSAFA